MATLRVRISPAGKLDIGVAGVQGAGCMSLTENLHRNLCGGAQVSLTDEHCQTQEQRQDINIQNGG